MKKYRVQLTEEEQQELRVLVSKGRAAAYKQTHARILLLSNEGCQGGAMKDEEISRSLQVGTATVERVRRRCEEGRVDAILVQQVQDAPDSYPAPILEERLVCQVPLSPSYRRRRLANRLAVRIPIQDGIFRPLLVVDDKRYGNPGAIGPFHHRRHSTTGDLGP